MNTAVVYGNKPTDCFAVKVHYSVKSNAVVKHDDLKKLVETEGLTPPEPKTLAEAFNQVSSKIGRKYRNGELITKVVVLPVKEEGGYITKIVEVITVDKSKSKMLDRVTEGKKVALLTLDTSTRRIICTTLDNVPFGREEDVRDFINPPSFLEKILESMEDKVYENLPYVNPDRIRELFKKSLAQHGIPARGLDTDFSIPVTSEWVVNALESVTKGINELVGKEVVFCQHGYSINYDETQIKEITADAVNLAAENFEEVVSKATVAAERYFKNVASRYEESCEAVDPDAYFEKYRLQLQQEETVVLSKIEEYGCLLSEDLIKIEESRNQCLRKIQELQETARKTLENSKVFGVRQDLSELLKVS